MNTHALPDQREDFPGWYGEVVRRAGLAENAPVRGAMVIKAHGYALWEAIQRALDERIKATGHENVYFPLLVPTGVLERERELVEGFAPEVAVVTHAGGKQLEEPLAVRPTSEALIWSTYARWIQSYRDLPLLYNQWANVVRWELRPRLFLRTTEFLWQEGHTAHETEAEARAEALTILQDVYTDVAERVLALPVLRGRKSAAERFPGAVETLAIEALMRDGKALQAGTSHYLGDGFARAYDVSFTDREGRQRHPHATSWGASTRLIGGVVMAHGDERGLRLPPEIAPDQAVVVPIFRDEERGEVLAAGERIVRSLRAAGIRARLDDRDGLRPGFKFHDWELKGTPVRLELGARDLADRVATLARRDTGAKQRVALADLPGVVTTTLQEVQQALFDQALAHRDAHTLRDPPTYAEAVQFLRGANGFVSSGWCGAAACEERVKQETAATIRCLSLDGAEEGCACLVCGARATERASWAQAY